MACISSQNPTPSIGPLLLSSRARPTPIFSATARPRSARKPTGDASWCWELLRTQIKSMQVSYSATLVRLNRRQITSRYGFVALTVAQVICARKWSVLKAVGSSCLKVV